MARPASRSSQSLPPRMQRLLREARALLVGCAALMLAAILLTHHAGRSRASARPAMARRLHNLGGQRGAWLSDLLLMLFGVSAWWWVVLAVAYVIHTFRHLDETPLAGGRQRWFRLGGFGLLLLASTGIEWLRTWHWAVALPDAHGGVLGAGVGGAAGMLFGFTGGTAHSAAADGGGLQPVHRRVVAQHGRAHRRVGGAGLLAGNPRPGRRIATASWAKWRSRNAKPRSRW